MGSPMLQFLNVGTGEATRRIAVRVRPGRGPAVLWLGGFRSDMRATKAEALDGWAERSGRAFLRFDYSGHGESGGVFEEGTLSRWLDDTLAVIDGFAAGPLVLVGSSMGGWLALLATRELLKRKAAGRACRSRADRACGRFHGTADVGQVRARGPADHPAGRCLPPAVGLFTGPLSDYPSPDRGWTPASSVRRHDRHRLPRPYSSRDAGPRRALEPRDGA